MAAPRSRAADGFARSGRPRYDRHPPDRSGELYGDERVEIGKVVEAELGKRQGQRTDLQNENQGGLLDDELSHRGDEVSGRTDEIAAEKAGFESRRSYRDAKTVVENAAPELVAAVDRRAPTRAHVRVDRYSRA